jgi:hypothetical protein
VDYWIQRHNYSSETQSNVSLAQAKAAYRNFDWDSELGLYREGVDGKDCPPGIGINNGEPLGETDSYLLHICPTNATNAFFNFHYPKSEKFLVIISYSNDAIHYVPNFPRDNVVKLIGDFYSANYGEILVIE